MDKSIPVGAGLLLDFIYRTETGKGPPGCYGVIFGNRQSALSKPLTSMTLGEVVDAQKTWSTKAWAKKFGSDKASSAAGAPQFMRATLIDLSKELHLSGAQPFMADFQDRLGYHLLKRRGYEDYIAGKISRTEFGKRLAMEWASLPVLADTKGAHRTVKRGQSYYAGDGLNKSLVEPAKVEGLLAAVRKSPDGFVVDPTPAPMPRPPDDPGVEPEPVKDEPISKSKRFWTWLTTGGGTAALPFVDWRVQFLIVVLIAGFAIYAIATMPQVRKKLGLA